MKPIVIFIIFMFSIPSLVFANDVCETHKARSYEPGENTPAICLHEPNTIGLTWDGDDNERFMDFKLSVKYQLIPEYSTNWLNKVKNHLGDNSAIYFAFSGRFGQYISTRDSSPVVGKRFNPEIFIRFWEDLKPGDVDHRESNYLDVSLFNHESNGQSINSQAGFDAAFIQASANGFNGLDAYDQISRSWNMFELTYKDKKEELIESTIKNQFFTIDATGYYGLKYFIPSQAEEFNRLGEVNPQGLQGWETDPEGKPRQQVDGVSLAYKGVIYLANREQKCEICPLKYYLGYTTGIRNPGHYKTWRTEFGFNFPYVDLPITLYWQTGYNSDLAQYYKKVSSVGFFVDIGSF